MCVCGCILWFFFSVKCVRQTTRRALYVWEVIFLRCFSVCVFFGSFEVAARLTKLVVRWAVSFFAFVYMCAALNFAYLIFQHDKTKYKMPIRAIPRMPTIHTCTCRYKALPYYILHTNIAQRESSHPICYVSVESHLHRSMLWQTPTMQCHCLLNTFFCVPASHPFVAIAFSSVYRSVAVSRHRSSAVCWASLIWSNERCTYAEYVYKCIFALQRPCLHNLCRFHKF